LNDDDDDDDNDIAESFNQRDEHVDSPSVYLAKTVAKRIVFRSLLHGVTLCTIKATEHIVEKQMLLAEANIANEIYATEKKCKAKMALKTSKMSGTHQSTLSGNDFDADNYTTAIGKETVEIAHPSRALYQYKLIYAAYITQNEDVEPVIFSSPTVQDFYTQCFHYLGCSDMSLINRVLTVPCLVYSTSIQGKSNVINLDKKSTFHNLRLSRWIFEYISHSGWKIGLSYVAYRKMIAREEKRESYDTAPNIIGDAVVLFRFGEEDMNNLITWCSSRLNETRMILEQRKRKEQDDTKRRVINYTNSRKFIYCIALKYKHLFDAMFNYDNYSKINSDVLYEQMIHEILPQQYHKYIDNFHPTFQHLRVLFSRYIELCQSNFDSQWTSIQLLDYNFAFSSRDIYQRFDTFLPQNFDLENNYDCYFCFQWNTYNTDLYDLRPQVGQIMYMLYQQHCCECTKEYSNCMVPGCGTIRSHAETLSLNQTHETSNDKHSIESHGTGDSPIEASIKQFLYSASRIFQANILPLSSNELDVLKKRSNCEYDVTEDKKGPVDNCSIADSNPIIVNRAKKSNGLVAMQWRNVEKEGGYLRYINRRVVDIHFRQFLDADDLILAKGGHDNREEKSYPYELTNKLDGYVPYFEGYAKTSEYNSEYNENSSTHSHDKIKYKESSLVSGTSAYNDNTAEFSILLPVSLVRIMRGASIPSHKEGALPLSSYDPAPPTYLLSKQEQEEIRMWNELTPKNTMSTDFYHWILQHIRILRESGFANIDDNNKSLDSNGRKVSKRLSGMIQSYDNNKHLGFDRLHYHNITKSIDESFIIVQVLHGIVFNENFQKMNSNLKFGCPEPARRYVSTDVLSSFEFGLTVLVHDVESDISRTIYVREKNMHRLAMSYNVDINNHYLLAKTICENANKMIKLHRMDGMCVDVSLYIDNFAVVPPVKVIPKPLAKPSFVHSGKNIGVFNGHNRRVRNAMNIMDDLDSLFE
jgi:hypothetical protein